MKVSFSVFLEGKGYTIESAWQSLYFSTNGWNTIQLSGMFWYFFPESFFRPVLTKKTETLFFFWNRFDIHHCQVRFSTSTFFERICSILRLFAHLHGQGRSWPGLIFLAAEFFCRRVFGKNNWKPSFLESKCYLVALVFYREQVLLRCLSSDFYPIYGIAKLVRPWSISCS